jgi:hypothetical protein
MTAKVKKKEESWEQERRSFFGRTPEKLALIFEQTLQVLELQLTIEKYFGNWEYGKL